ncbi:MAG: PilZ domain-containing protein [Acidobacteriota bacterium]|nr:PilZ domain-containing protein [Acidobacteriota bacterium]
MGRRTKNRIELVLPVRIWGMDSAGKPFSQFAHTTDVSHEGARLAGVRCLLGLDDVIGLQYKQLKARCKVVWVGRPGTAKHDQIAFEYLEGEKNVWALELHNEDQADEFEVAGTRKETAGSRTEVAGSKKEEKRGHQRLSCSGGAEVRTQPDAPMVWTVLADISRCGCYLQTPSALPVKTYAEVLIKAGDVEISSPAVVRTCDPGVGMGLEFAAMDAENKQRLHELIERLGGTAQPPEEASKLRREEIGQRLQKASAEVRHLEEMLLSEDVDAEVLGEFREALGHARHSAWAVQQWMELHAKRDDPFPVISFLNLERVRLVTLMCQHLAKDIQAVQLEVPKQEIAALVRAVEDLFQNWPGGAPAPEGK